ncbi:Long-chain-fatty-acid--CoA ligase 1 [Anabarilius grahami]|uniref:Long-chain-fatty-acid--CoA ligase 1 n=1 Tax=Anabarilius grahami TaxID=495550 RepID=A0A3N0XNG2_ANAGA|nr:Long-chain-fatty-acid--CoA ligase 1 [Anabarilius grahami]
MTLTHSQQTRCRNNNMAGNSKEQQLSLRVYNTLQSLGCPLVDGLYLREADSVQELLCSPSLHRTDILKWICTREKLSKIKAAQNENLIQELTRFGNEMMLCKANDQDLIKDVKKAVLEDMTAVGKEAGLKSFEQVKDLYLHPEMFSVSNGLLTPTLKSKRVDLRRLFGEQIAQMYSKSSI